MSAKHDEAVEQKAESSWHQKNANLQLNCNNKQRNKLDVLQHSGGF
jgi:hypothetical protein